MVKNARFLPFYFHKENTQKGNTPQEIIGGWEKRL